MALVVAVVLGLLSFSSYSAAAVTTQTTMVAVALAQTMGAVAKKNSIRIIKRAILSSRPFYY